MKETERGFNDEGRIVELLDIQNMPNCRHSLRVKTLIEFLMKRFGNPPYWDAIALSSCDFKRDLLLLESRLWVHSGILTGYSEGALYTSEWAMLNLKPQMRQLNLRFWCRCDCANDEFWDVMSKSTKIFTLLYEQYTHPTLTSPKSL
jgi:hypothetical protein